MDDRMQEEVERLAREFAGRVTRVVAEAIARELRESLSRHLSAESPSSEREDEGDAGRRGRSTRREATGPSAGADGAGGRPERAAARVRRAAAGGVDSWVPDRRARRVPNFVIEQTGLETKKEIVERYGEHKKFVKGEPCPPPLRATPGNESEEDAS